MVRQFSPHPVPFLSRAAVSPSGQHPLGDNSQGNDDLEEYCKSVIDPSTVPLAACVVCTESDRLAVLAASVQRSSA